jgi:hypothetical protein
MNPLSAGMIIANDTGLSYTRMSLRFCMHIWPRNALAQDHLTYPEKSSCSRSIDGLESRYHWHNPGEATSDQVTIPECLHF